MSDAPVKLVAREKRETSSELCTTSLNPLKHSPNTAANLLETRAARGKGVSAFFLSPLFFIFLYIYKNVPLSETLTDL